MIKKFLKNNPIHRKIVPVFDILFLLRPTLFFPVWVMIVVGMAMAKMQFTEYPIWLVAFDVKVFILFIGFSFISASTFILNQIKDVDSDNVNKKLFIVGNKIKITKAELIMKISLGIGILSLIIVNFGILLIGLLLFLFWGVLYNLKPLEAKKKPIIGAVINAIAGFLLYFAGWVMAFSEEGIGFFSSINLDLFTSLSPYILCFIAVSLLTTIPDRKGDSDSGTAQPPVSHHPKTSHPGRRCPARQYRTRT